MKDRFYPLIKLFLRFFQFGCFTFGGGWGIIAQMQKEYVEKQHLITEAELLDITSVGKSLPGVMISNTAFLFGYHLYGLPGGFACVFGMILPPIVTLAFVAQFYDAIRDNVYIAKAMVGVRAAVVPIIFNAVLRLRKGAYPFPLCYAVTLAAIALNLLLNVNCVYIVLFAALAGIAINLIHDRREKNGVA